MMSCKVQVIAAEVRSQLSQVTIFTQKKGKVVYMWTDTCLGSV
jgi:hypothetical protein